MQVLCKSSDERSDVCCGVCGQGFVLFWERQSKVERALAMPEIAKTLREQHVKDGGREAHPQHGFLVPEWSGRIESSGAAILGSAPSWAL